MNTRTMNTLGSKTAMHAGNFRVIQAFSNNIPKSQFEN